MNDINQEIIISNIRFKLLMDNYNGGVLLSGENHQIILVNNTFCNMFSIRGQLCHKIIGEHCSFFVKNTPENFLTPDEMLDTIEKLIKNKRREYNKKIILRNGKVLLMDFIPVIKNENMWLYREAGI